MCFAASLPTRKGRQVSVALLLLRSTKQRRALLPEGEARAEPKLGAVALDGSRRLCCHPVHLDRLSGQGEME